MSRRPGNGGGEQAPLLQGDGTASGGGGGGGGGYGGVSKASNGSAPDLASTMYHQSSIFHSMGKGVLVVSLTGRGKREEGEFS